MATAQKQLHEERFVVCRELWDADIKVNASLEIEKIKLKCSSNGIVLLDGTAVQEVAKDAVAAAVLRGERDPAGGDPRHGGDRARRRQAAGGRDARGDGGAAGGARQGHQGEAGGARRRQEVKVEREKENGRRSGGLRRFGHGRFLLGLTATFQASRLQASAAGCLEDFIDGF